MIQKPLRPFLIVLGWISFSVGIVALFVPLVPTTPFILLAAWLFSISSEKAHQWLLNHKRMGPLIREWEQHRVIRTRYKVIATVMMLSMMSYPLFFKEGIPGSARIAMVVVATLVLGFIWTRPSEVRSE